jgi:hypothetical protein
MKGLDNIWMHWVRIRFIETFWKEFLLLHRDFFIDKLLHKWIHYLYMHVHCITECKIDHQKTAVAYNCASLCQTDILTA